MAESTSKTVLENAKATDPSECAVCLQPFIHPAQLPCGHVFCFLCVKGIANQNNRCAMCRKDIPRDFFDHPKLLDGASDLKTLDAEGGEYQWFYEGRNGWWQYDERTSRELETSYKSGERSCELLIAGLLYIADFDSMIQRRRHDSARRRRIKRDLSSIPKKGIAGIKLAEESTNSDRSESPINICPTPPVTPAEVPQTPTESELRDDLTSMHESLQSTIEQMQALSLREDSNDSEDEAETTSDHNMYFFAEDF